MNQHRLAWGAVGFSAAIHAALILWGPAWGESEPRELSRDVDLLPPMAPAQSEAGKLDTPVDESSVDPFPRPRPWVDRVALRRPGRVMPMPDLSMLRVDEEGWGDVVNEVADEVESQVELPVLLSGPDPPYPRRSRELGEEGTVVLAIFVGEDGRVRDCAVLRSSGYPLLDGSALITARDRWRFRPSREAGRPVGRWVRVPVEFRIAAAWSGR